jgi:hypothetical protein
MLGNFDRSILTLAVIAALGGCDGGNPTPCAVADDCWNSSEAEQAGRCAPKDVWCDQGECRVRCAELCTLIQPDINPCKDPALICTESTNSGAQLPFCTDHAISCSTVDDCPLFHPMNADAEWECVDSLCQYPGFEYPNR